MIKDKKECFEEFAEKIIKIFKNKEFLKEFILMDGKSKNAKEYNIKFNALIKKYSNKIK